MFCDSENETTQHYLLRCPRFHQPRAMLLNTISDVLTVPDIIFVPDEQLCHIILFGSETQSDDINKLILNATIRYIRATKRFVNLEAYETANLN